MLLNKREIIDKLNMMGNADKFKFNKFIHLSEWKHYYQSYNYIFSKVIEKSIERKYVNFCGIALLFLYRHSLELCFKYNLANLGLGIPVSHKFKDMEAAFPDVSIIPVELIQIKEILDLGNPENDGSCFRYYEDKQTNSPYFTYYGNHIQVDKLLEKHNSISSIIFIVDKTSTKYNYNIPKIKGKMTATLGECRGLGQLRTQFDCVIEMIIIGIIEEGFDIKLTYLPLMFLIRHSLEIALKFNIVDIQKRTTKIKNKEIRNEHSLVKLFNIYNNFLDTVDVTIFSKGVKEDFLKYKRDYAQFNRQIHDLDINSRFFRFPTDKDGNNQNIPLDKFDLLEVIRLYCFLDTFITFTNEVLDEHDLISETKMTNSSKCILERGINCLKSILFKMIK